MTELLSEAIGTFVLILFGCGLNAGLSLNKSYSNKNTSRYEYLVQSSTDKCFAD